MPELPKKLVDLITEAKKPEPTNELCFLIGSGFSRADHMLLVGDINKKLRELKESDFFLGQEMSAWFYKDDFVDPNQKITLFDRRFAEEFVHFYIVSECQSNPEKFNYEVFFDYFNEYLYEKQHKDKVDKFVEEHKAKYNITGNFENGRQYLSRFLNIFNQLVASLLTTAKYYQNISYTGGYPNYEQFSRLLKQVLKGNIVHVHSLNHDMLFDHLASTVSGIFEFFSDGFTELNSPYFGEIRQAHKINNEDFYKTYKVRLQYFNNQYKSRLRFYKLHGSVDTYPLYLQGTDESVTIKVDYGVGEIFKEVLNKEKGQYEYVYPFSNKYPAYLTGTTQKIKRYEDPFFAELFNHFKNNLQSSEKLIVIGYGFQDKGINDLLEANFLSSGKRIFVVDIKAPECDLLKKYPDQFTITGTGIAETHFDQYMEFLN
ncbi:MAG TPA: hypothetical protein VGN20_26220 [Mucilaginibacter sp.]|jgi:hypothetical protein